MVERINRWRAAQIGALLVIAVLLLLVATGCHRFMGHREDVDAGEPLFIYPSWVVHNLPAKTLLASL